jgi:hypothetical protein
MPGTFSNKITDGGSSPQASIASANARMASLFNAWYLGFAAAALGSSREKPLHGAEMKITSGYSLDAQAGRSNADISCHPAGGSASWNILYCSRLNRSAHTAFAPILNELNEEEPKKITKKYFIVYKALYTSKMRATFGCEEQYYNDIIEIYEEITKETIKNMQNELLRQINNDAFDKVFITNINIL